MRSDGTAGGPLTNTDGTGQTGTIAAVIVTYFPVPHEIGRLIEAIAPQVARVIVVDNTPGDGTLPVHGQSAEVIRVGSNVGLAKGQNIGIQRARAIGATHVMLFDQDSEPTPHMVQTLLAAVYEIESRGVRVAAVGPRWLDRSTREAAPFIRVGWTGLRHVRRQDAAGGLIDVDFLIASGSLIPTRVLEDVGTMDEVLFIDHVDIEWAFRAAARGYKLYGVNDAVLFHNLGESRRRVWLGKWWKVPVHSPLRNYYFARNTILVDRRPYVGWRWRFSSCLRLGALGLCFATQVPPRLPRIKAFLLGVRDGLVGRGGPAPV
jgi:rhamnosyltransferase